MHSDGQMYSPPSLENRSCDTQIVSKSVFKGIGSEDLLLIGLALLLLSDRTETDVLLIMAIVYVLFAK